MPDPEGNALGAVVFVLGLVVVGLVSWLGDHYGPYLRALHRRRLAVVYADRGGRLRLAARWSWLNPREPGLDVDLIPDERTAP